MQIRDLAKAFLPKKAPATPGADWYRATVTQVSPLRVQFDTDDVAHAATPDSGVLDLAVGDVVWCVFSGTRVLIVMKVRGALTTVADCNATTVPGDYVVSGDVTTNNRPPNSNYGILRVSNPGTFGYTGDVVQVFYGYGNVTRVWYRRYWQYTATWSAWRLFGGEPDTISVRNTSTVGPTTAWNTLTSDIEAQLPYGVWDVMAGVRCINTVNNDDVIAFLYNRASGGEIGNTTDGTASRGAAGIVRTDAATSLLTSRVILTVTDPVNPLRVGIAIHPNGASAPKIQASANGPSQWITAVRIG